MSGLIFYITMIKKPTKLIPKYRKLIEGLRNSENRYQALFEQSRDAIIITSRKGNSLILINPHLIFSAMTEMN